MSTARAPRIQVFRPTMEEFKDFSKYIEYIESQGAHKAGLAKIIPPEGWVPRRSGYDDIDLVIPSPITQVISGSLGLFQQFNISQKSMTVKEYRKLAESKKFCTPPHFDYEELERRYWKNIAYNPPIYGADVSGSLYDEGVEEFNIQRLNTILDLVKEDYEIQIEGVNTAYLYFGMWKTTFAWHTEDMDLYSINYVHYGAPKSWYVIPPEHGRRLERLATNFFNQSFSECSSFLRHKMTVISPHVLKKFCIPFSKITQEPGEFMITFPYAYHSGFNHGFNIAESTNFALPRWIEYGKRATSCICRNDCVKICMDIFVRRFQPERYELWKEGKDIGCHPEDPSRQYAAPAPKKLELAVSAQRQRQKKETQKIKRHPVAKMKDISKAGKMKHINYKSPVTESDEETKLYDVNEMVKDELPKKNGQKRAKKQKTSEKVKIRKSCQVVNKKNKKNANLKERVEDVKVGGEWPSEKKKNELESRTDFSTDEEASVKEIKQEIKEETNEIINYEIKEENLNSTKEEMIEHSKEKSNEEFEKYADEEITDKKSEEIMDKKNEELIQPVDSEVINWLNVQRNFIAEQTATLDNPPELQPFWDPEGKLKKENNGKTSEAYNSKMRLLESYPNLQKAVNAGAFSVVALDSEHLSGSNETSNCKREIKFEHNVKLEMNIPNYDSPISNQTWRCETNGLKIKFVQPKISPATTPSCEKSSMTHEISPKNEIDSSSSPLERNENEQTSSQVHQFELSPLISPNDSSSAKQAKDLNSKVKRADNSDTTWARSLVNLWQHQPKNFDAEIIYNEKLASISPHCAICAIFSPQYNNNFPSEPSHVPSYSAVKMPAYCYGNSLNSECIIDTNSLIRMDGTCPVLTCSTCKVSVHATCYGVSMLPNSPWMCTRCTEKAFEAECCLCVLRGGALKPTTDGRWVHLICAILIAEAFFESTAQKHPINVSKITPNRQRLRCRYCFKASLTKESKGACVQCRSGKCYLPFHVTCGFMAGVIFETADWPEPIHMICTKHVAARRKPQKRELTTVSVGEKVITKHKNKRYYWANVVSKYIQEYYSILFDDNSHSTNTHPEDIVERSKTQYGTPEINEKVRVKWPDGEIYNGIFKGSHSCELFVIEFDDGTIMRLERKEIYAADEELPKAVKSKISHSSERFNINFESEAFGKRVRISSHKYNL